MATIRSNPGAALLFSVSVVARLARTTKDRSQRALVSVEWRHRHHAAHGHTREPPQPLGFDGHTVERVTTLGFFLHHIDLHQHAHRLAPTCPHRVQRVGDALAVHRLNEREASRMLDLVPL